VLALSQKQEQKPQVQKPVSAMLQAKFQQGLALYQHGRLAEAEKLYEEILKQEPTHFGALHLLGVVALRTRRTQRGVELIAKAIEINPNVAAAHSNLGYALSALKLHEQALASYDKAIALKPDYADAYNNRGAALRNLRRHAEALASYDKAIALKPDYADAYNNRGNALSDLKRHDEALASYDKAIALKPDYSDAHYNRGTTLRSLNRHDEALASYDKAIALKPDHAEAYNNRGAALGNLKRHTEALASCDKAIALKLDYAEAHNNRGIALRSLKRDDEALASYDKAIVLKPDYPDAHYNRGNALSDLKRDDEALASYDKAIALKPDYADAHYNRGIALSDLKRHDEALASYDKAIALKPDYADAYNNRGIALNELKRPEQALASYDKAIALKPDYADAYNNRGIALNELKRSEQALASYDQAIALKPDYADAYNNRGIALNELKRSEQALASYGRAIALRPDYADAHYNRGNALRNLKRYDEALASYDKAITLKPDHAEAYNNRGTVLEDLKRNEEAIASYEKAIALNPDVEFLLGNLIHTRMIICDWINLETQIDQLIHKINRAEKVSTPYPILSISGSPELQRKAAEIYVLARNPLNNALPEIAKRQRHQKIRIGYFSADFREHPIANLAAELFERHDRSQFEVTAFSFGTDTRDDLRRRLEVAFDKFIDVRNQSDKEVALLARNLEIDIAVDLGGFTMDCRTNIFSMRAAPVQVNYLGYPGTMGAEYIDYLIADCTLIPTQMQKYYTEKIAYLPNSCIPNDAKRVISNRLFDRAEFGLPHSAFVFCGFNNSYKLNPSIFDCWMRILKKAEGSVLWLSESNATAAANLKKEADTRGVDSNRLVFARKMPLLADHLARHRLADLFLDVLPFNAHTTASDALWAGLPVLTQIGESFIGRVAASRLNAIGLPELITSTRQEYEDLAIELATNLEKLTAIKDKLANNRLTTPLFDTQLFTRNIETAYTAMYERYQADLPPDHIYVPH
jgi:predicted O-linked N-acetylglucosamine transferase (SPINDLY family)